MNTFEVGEEIFFQYQTTEGVVLEHRGRIVIIGETLALIELADEVEELFTISRMSNITRVYS